MKKIQKNPRLKSLSVLLAASLVTLGVSWSYAEIIDISGTFGNPYHFSTNFENGNAGSISFSGLSINTDTPSNPTLDGKWIFLETVGWAQLENQTTNLTNANISIPIEVGSGVSSWPLTGNIYAWNDNAGWLTLHSLEPDYYSGVSYIPGSRSFSGYAWSNTLGYVDLSATNIVFKNKVKILGNIGGTKAFDTEYYVWEKFNTISVTSLMNTIRKNAALMTRGIAAGSINDRINTDTLSTTPKKLNSDTLYYIINGTVNNPWTLMDDSDTRSLVVEWGDVYISADVDKDANVNKARAIIVLKDKDGNGGNIYIGKNVKNIYTSLIAEGTIYSGENSTTLYNRYAIDAPFLPRNQLYILGSVISRNTIGWATLLPNFSCPYTEWACNENTSIKYDWNYFRTYDKKSINQSDNHNWEDYSVIMEHDSRLIIDPPPGLAN